MKIAEEEFIPVLVKVEMEETRVALMQLENMLVQYADAEGITVYEVISRLHQRFGEGK